MLEDSATGAARLQPCKSPVWDTAITLRALAAGGIGSDRAEIRRAVDWLLRRQILRQGDWSQTVHVEPGAWCFEYHNDFYPDCDDTIMALMALREQFEPEEEGKGLGIGDWGLGAPMANPKSKIPQPQSPIPSRPQSPSQPNGGQARPLRTAPSSQSPPPIPDLRLLFHATEQSREAAAERIDLTDRSAVAIQRGLRWLLAMQNDDGGWAAFDRNNTRRFLCYVPFADHNAMIDPSTPDLTGRVLEALGKLGFRVGRPAVDRAVACLRRSQEADGSWRGRWGVNYIYGTWQALVGLAAVGVPKDDLTVVAGADWLATCQQPCGGWGETPETYADPRLRGTGPTTASQTAWAVMGLLAAGRRTTRPRSAASSSSSIASGRTASGTSRNLPGPASPGSSISATITIRSTSRSWPSRAGQPPPRCRRSKPPSRRFASWPRKKNSRRFAGLPGDSAVGVDSTEVANVSSTNDQREPACSMGSGRCCSKRHVVDRTGF